MAKKVGCVGCVHLVLRFAVCFGLLVPPCASGLDVLGAEDGGRGGESAGLMATQLDGRLPTVCHSPICVSNRLAAGWQTHPRLVYQTPDQCATRERGPIGSAGAKESVMAYGPRGQKGGATAGGWRPLAARRGSGPCSLPQRRPVLSPNMPSRHLLHRRSFDAEPRARTGERGPGPNPATATTLPRLRGSDSVIYLALQCMVWPEEMGSGGIVAVDDGRAGLAAAVRCEKF